MNSTKTIVNDKETDGITVTVVVAGTWIGTEIVEDHRSVVVVARLTITVIRGQETSVITISITGTGIVTRTQTAQTLLTAVVDTRLTETIVKDQETSGVKVGIAIWSWPLARSWAVKLCRLLNSSCITETI